VRVTLDPAVLARTDAALRLAERYGLEAAYLVPEGPGAPLDRVARAAAMWLDDLAPRQGTLGVAWGETIHRLATLLPRRSHPGMTVVQLVGSMASPFGFTAETCTSLIAERMGAACVNLHAPAVLSDRGLVAALLAEPIRARQIEALNACDAAHFAVGLATEDSHVVRAGVATPEELHAYRAAGAAAVVAGRFIDDAGAPIAGPLDGRVIGIEPAALSHVPLRLVVSAGPGRTPALRAALRGGFATHLVVEAGAAPDLLG
jgi:DNA-binding transcriptional regulator LsrR (DeoR family)